MKILEISNYSKGGCGVFTRALGEAKLLSKKHEVKIFSSYYEKGTNEIMPARDEQEGVEIQRFPAKYLGGESFMYWNFEKDALEFSPDIIIAHNYRHPCTLEALKVAKELRKKGKKVKVFLVTHAPFVEGNITRSFFSKMSVFAYDKLIGPRTLNEFNKILVISKWEIPYLIERGAEKERIVYIPNGIPDEFFKGKKGREENKILLLARIAPKKKVETLIEAIPMIKDKKVKIEIVGPPEEPYYSKIVELARKLKIENRVSFPGPVYDLKKKIAKIDSAKIFVLPSRVEGMPQSLIEAMAREKIVIGSDSIAIRDIIKSGVNGYLFEFNNPKDLARKIDLALKEKREKIKKNARESVQSFAWSKVIKQIEKVINS